MSNVKEFIKEWKPKKLGKEERIDMLKDSIPAIVQFYVKKGHKEPELVAELFEKMSNPKFPATLLKVIKAAKEEDTEIDVGMATVIADLLERKGSGLEEEVVGMYADAVDKILKKRIKKLNEKLGIDKDVLKELLVVVPDKEYITDPKYVGIYVNRMLRKLYILAKDTAIGLDGAKQIKKLFKALFDEELLSVIAIGVLLEKKETMKGFNEKQLAVWNLMTNFALNVINDMDKDAIKEIMEFYVDRRAKDAEKNRDAARRIPLSQVSEDDFAKIAKVVGKMAEKDKYKKYL